MVKINQFKLDLSLKKRQEVSSKILENYPDRVPVMLCTFSSDIIEMDKTRFITPLDLKFGQFIHNARKFIKINETEALFMMCEYKNSDILVPVNMSIAQVYEKYKDEDGCLYVYVTKESTFGY